MTKQSHFQVNIQKKMKTLIQKDTFSPVFIAAVFIIAKTLKCPSTDEWINTTQCYMCACVCIHIYVCVYIYICVCVYIHTRACDKKEQNNVIKKSMPFAATQMNLEIIILSEVRKRKTNTI